MAKEDDLFYMSLDLPCVASRVQELLGVNPKTWSDLQNKGIIPPNPTYRQALNAVHTHYFKQNEVAIIKAQAAIDKGNNKKSNRSYDTESGLSTLEEAQIIQKIKLDRAREEVLYINNIKDRGLVLIKEELYNLIAPMFGNIASILRAAADENPELQPPIDKAFESLYRAGKRMGEQVDNDTQEFVNRMLTRDVDLEALLDAALEI